MAEDGKKSLTFRRSKGNNCPMTDDTLIKLHEDNLTIVIYIQHKFHVIPSIGYLVMAEDRNFKRNFCKQTVENLIRRRILRRLIWFCTVCQCLTKRTLGLYLFVLLLYVPSQQLWSLRDGQFTYPHFFLGRLEQAVNQ